MNSTVVHSFIIGVAALIAARPAAASALTSPIAPGDVIFTELFSGWHKLDPSTGVVTPLPWPASSAFTQHVAFDVDGAILFDDQPNQLKRLNPLTGVVTTLSAPAVNPSRGFAVETNGDILVAQAGSVSRFSRATGQATPIVSGTFFSPMDVAIGANQRIFITEFFDHLWELESATGNRTIATTPELVIPDLIEVRSDGDLIVENFTPDIMYRINPDTGALSLFTDDLPTFVNDIALAADNTMWLTSTDGVFRYSSAGGAKSLVASGQFFRPEALAIVPLNWTPPPVPEPSAVSLVLVAVVTATSLARTTLINKRQSTIIDSI